MSTHFLPPLCVISVGENEEGNNKGSSKEWYQGSNVNLESV